MADIMITKIRHWLPIMTFCPVNHLPDFVYVTVTHKGQFVELYGARRKINRAIRFKKTYMEQLCEIVAKEFPQAAEIKVTLLFARHTVIIKRK